MENKQWQAQNLAALQQRLQPLLEKADGVLYFEPAGLHFNVVIKQGHTLRLVLVEQARPEVSFTQTRLNLKDPLNLPSRYAQAFLLGLVWQPSPRRVAMIGLGGGRLPVVLHHYLPAAVIECVDIEPSLVGLAHTFFGVPVDERLLIAVDDGRHYLAQQPVSKLYELLCVDVFLGNGYSPYKLATREFAELCRRHLAPAGVLIVNFFSDDPYLNRKIATLQAVFEQVYTCKVAGNLVVLATAAPPLPAEEIVARSLARQKEHYFRFALQEWARKLQPVIVAPDPRQVLLDDDPPPAYFEALPSFTGAFSQVTSHVSCPCGSGLLYRECHGRMFTDPPATG